MHQQFSFNRFTVQRLAVGFVLLLSLFVVAARAQDGDDDVVRVKSNLVVLNVGVADRRGRAITDLRREDFTVYEDGVRQSIESFEPTTAPFSLVMLLDLSGSTLNFRTTLKQSALRFLDTLAPDDRVAVVIFNDRVQMREAFTTERLKTAVAIRDLTNERGSSDFYKALKYSLDQLAKEGKRRKAIIVLSDGLDTDMRRLDGLASANAQTDAEAIAAVKPDESQPLRSVLDLADRQGVTIYPLALPSGDPKRLPSLTPQQSAIYASARARMETLANRTGGRLHQINRLEDMGRLYAEVAADMRTLYSIAYQSAGARTADGKWRAINIEVTRAEAIARTRPGYYAR